MPIESARCAAERHVAASRILGIDQRDHGARLHLPFVRRPERRRDLVRACRLDPRGHLLGCLGQCPALRRRGLCLWFALRLRSRLGRQSGQAAFRLRGLLGFRLGRRLLRRQNRSAWRQNLATGCGRRPLPRRCHRRRHLLLAFGRRKHLRANRLRVDLGQPFLARPLPPPRGEVAEANRVWRAGRRARVRIERLRAPRGPAQPQCQHNFA